MLAPQTRLLGFTMASEGSLPYRSPIVDSCRRALKKALILPIQFRHDQVAKQRSGFDQPFIMRGIRQQATAPRHNVNEVFGRFCGQHFATVQPGSGMTDAGVTVGPTSRHTDFLPPNADDVDARRTLEFQIRTVDRRCDRLRIDDFRIA